MTRDKADALVAAYSANAPAHITYSAIGHGADWSIQMDDSYFNSSSLLWHDEKSIAADLLAAAERSANPSPASRIAA